MAATDFIVAIELGSTEITGIAGKKNALILPRSQPTALKKELYIIWIKPHKSSLQ